MNNLKVGVLLGGHSSERDVSIRSGKAISKTLKACGYEVVEIGETGPIESGIITNNIDIAFIALHGSYGEDGTIQQFLEDHDIPYTGSGPEASRRALDKHTAKVLFSQHAVPTPEYLLLNFEENGDLAKELNDAIKNIKSAFSFPVVLKPVNEGSSIGLSIVEDKEQLIPSILNAYKYSKKILVEKYIHGDEITVGVLGKAPLAVIQIVPQSGFYDYKSKYTKGMTNYIVPAKIPPDIYRHVQFLALQSHNTLGCRDFSRVDLRLDKKGAAWVLEVNTIPGFTETSLLPKSANAVGIGFEALCKKMLEMAMERNEVKIIN